MSAAEQEQKRERQIQDLAAGGPGLVTIAGQEYLVAHPAEMEMAALFQFVRQALTNGKPAPTEIDGQLYLDTLSTLAGCRFFAFVVLRKYQPQLKKADIETLIPDDFEARLLFWALYEASGMDAAGNSAGRSGTSPAGTTTGAPSTAA